MVDFSGSSESNHGVPIAEAAQILGVSERTIYRMVRAGRLKCVSRPDRHDTRVKVILSGMEKKEAIQSQKAPNSCVSNADNSGKVSDMDIANRLARLEQELTLKDAQIAELMRQQREMLEAVQRSNEQMFELMRLLLVQYQSTIAVNPAAEPAGQGWLDRLRQLLVKQNS